MEIAQFSTRDLYQVGGKALGSSAVKNCLGDFVPEGPDHAGYVSLFDTDIKVNVSTYDTIFGARLVEDRGAGRRRVAHSPQWANTVLNSVRTSPSFSTARMARRFVA